MRTRANKQRTTALLAPFNVPEQHFNFILLHFIQPTQNLQYLQCMEHMCWERSITVISFGWNYKKINLNHIVLQASGLFICLVFKHEINCLCGNNQHRLFKKKFTPAAFGRLLPWCAANAEPDRTCAILLLTLTHSRTFTSLFLVLFFISKCVNIAFTGLLRLFLIEPIHSFMSIWVIKNEERKQMLVQELSRAAGFQIIIFLW